MKHLILLFFNLLMDKRKLIKQTEISIADQINTKLVNLEVANTIENSEDLKSILQAKANQQYFQSSPTWTRKHLDCPDRWGCSC